MSKKITINVENEQPFNEIYAFLSLDENGNEGICSVHTAVGHMPAVFGHARMINVFSHFVEDMLKDQPEMKIRLVKFTNKEVLKIYEDKK